MRFHLLFTVAAVLTAPTVQESDRSRRPWRLQHHGFHVRSSVVDHRRQSALSSPTSGGNVLWKFRGGADTSPSSSSSFPVPTATINRMDDDSFVDEFRGGFSEKSSKKKEDSSAAASSGSSSQLVVSEKVIAGAFALLVASLLVYHNWESLKPFLDKAYIQEKTLTILKDLESNPLSLPIYACGMALWELAGLSTIPVETAAGMVFGFHKAFLASGAGKLLGASAAFGLGRGLLSNYVQEQLKQNPVWSIVNRSTAVHSPLVVGLLMKFSCFPELIKNFGSSCVQQLSYTTFLTATMIHGLTFTVLWTCLGVDAAARLETPDLPANMTLQVVLVVAAMIGLVGSPLLMAWWIRDMRKLAGQDPSPPQKQE